MNCRLCEEIIPVDCYEDHLSYHCQERDWSISEELKILRHGKNIGTPISIELAPIEIALRYHQGIKINPTPFARLSPEQLHHSRIKAAKPTPPQPRYEQLSWSDDDFYEEKKETMEEYIARQKAKGEWGEWD
jgi:hypothetical protein